MRDKNWTYKFDAPVQKEGAENMGPANAGRPMMSEMKAQIAVLESAGPEKGDWKMQDP